MSVVVLIAQGLIFFGGGGYYLRGKVFKKMSQSLYIFRTSRMWNLLNVRLFTGICKLCRNDHLAVVRVVNIGEDSFMVQSEEPAVTQSEEPAVTQSEEPAVTPSEELAIAQSEELSRTT